MLHLYLRKSWNQMKMCFAYLCVNQLPWSGSLVPWYDQIHAVWGVRVQGASVPPRTGGTFPFQLLTGQSDPPRGRVHPRQVPFLIHLTYSHLFSLLNDIPFLSLRFANIEIKSVKFEDSLFENCYFEDIRSTNTFFENCTIKNTVFYNTGIMYN